MPLIFRNQKGSNLTADEVDGNFKYLHERLQQLEEGIMAPETLEDITVSNGQITIKGSKGSVFGPFALPSASLSIKEAWSSQTPYSKNDLVQREGALYKARHSHKSDEVFDPTSWDVVFDGRRDANTPLQVPVYETKELPEPKVGAGAARVDEDGVITPVFSNGSTWTPFRSK